MMALPERNKNYMQMCWVVPDLEKAIHQWVNMTGAGPFFIFEDLHFDDSTYRGKAQDVQDCRAAIGQFGDMQIEFIQPKNEGPGLWTDVVPKGEFGFHHTCLYCEDYVAQRDAYLDAGATMVFEGLMMGHTTGYIDTVSELGFMTELVTANPVAESVFRAIREASVGWDGSDPIRTLG